MKLLITGMLLLGVLPGLHSQEWEAPLGGLRAKAITKVGGPFLKAGEGSIIVLKDGRLLHAVTRHQINQDVAPAIIAQSTSSDGGVTWTEPVLLFKSTTGFNAMQPGFVRMKNGELGVSYTRLDSISHATKVFRYSKDEGVTWSEEILMTPSDSYWTSAHDRMLCLPGGRILIPLHHKKVVKPEQMTTQLGYSDDNGRTWKLSPNEVSTDAILPAFAKKFAANSSPGFWEGSIAERGDGSLMMMGRTYAGVQYMSLSTDDGLHWSKPEPTTVPSGATPARLVRIPGSNDLLVLWNSCCVNEEDGLLGSRLNMSSAVSHDGGKTWHMQRDIETISPGAGNRIEYPTVTFVNGKALITYRVGTMAGGVSQMQEYLSILPIAWFYVSNVPEKRLQ